MKHQILVPVDFTNASVNSLQYAAALCRDTKTEMVILHVVHPPKNDEEDAAAKLQKHGQQLDNFVKSNLENVDTAKLKFQCMVKFGWPVSKIIETAKSGNFFFVLLGTRARHSFAEYLLGSVCTRLEKQTDTPLLIVPEGKSYEPIEHIAFPSDINFTKKSIRHYLKNMADFFKASIHQLFIIPPTKVSAGMKEDVQDAGWLDKEASDFSKVTVIRDKSFKSGLNFYIKNHQPQIIAMYVSHREGILSIPHKSMAQKVTEYSKLPLLVFREDAIAG